MKRHPGMFFKVLYRLENYALLSLKLVQEHMPVGSFFSKYCIQCTMKIAEK